LHKIKIWNASQIQSKIANPDEVEKRVVISYGGSSVVGLFGQQYFDSQPVLAQFQQLMIKLLESHVETL
jgi:hypothetical protein